VLIGQNIYFLLKKFMARQKNMTFSRTKSKRKRFNPENPPEEYEQRCFVAWLKKNNYLRFSHAANGGKRHYLEAVKFKAMGVSPGFPDLFIPIPSGQYPAIFIEMKRKKGGRCTPEQVEWLDYLRSVGFHAVVANGFDAAKELFLDYISLK
jgi:hypothetical protein